MVVTTEFRGVFFGYIEADNSPSNVVLADARNCVYWTSSVRGVLGLAAAGPDKGCRIGPKVPRITLQKITSVAECTPEAVQKWESAPWS